MMMRISPWMGGGGGGRVLLGLLPCLLLCRVGSNYPLCLLWFVADEKTCVGQGHTAL